MTVLNTYIEKGLIKKINSSKDALGFRIAEFIFINDKLEVIAIGQTRNPVLYINQFQSRCRGSKPNNLSYSSFTRLTEASRKEEWRIYAITNNKFRNSDIVRDIIKDVKYTIIGRLEKFKSYEEDKSPYSLFKVVVNKSSLIRYTHARSTIDHGTLVERIKGNLESSKSSLSGNSSKRKVNPNWPQLRQSFIDSTEFTVTRLEEHEYNPDKIKSVLTISRDLNLEALRNAK